MENIFIYPYKTGSKSVKILKNYLNAKVILLENSKFKGKGKIVMNWGNSKGGGQLLEARVFNKPEAVAIASNKKDFFNAVNGQVPIPEFTTDVSIAEGWIKKGKKVVVREKLQGNSGDGIIFIDSIEAWDDYEKDKAKLYVLYIPKKDEYRVHVMGGKVIDVQKKAAKKDYPTKMINWQIRNHDNGFIFKREGINPHPQVQEVSVNAINIVGLDFGAVDVIWNSYLDQAFVLEINTAPGLEGQTVKNYIKGLTEMFEAYRLLPKGLKYSINAFGKGDNHNVMNAPFKPNHINYDGAIPVGPEDEESEEDIWEDIWEEDGEEDEE